MKLDAVMVLILLLSLVLVGASLFGMIRPTPFLSDNRYWLMLGGYGILSLGLILRAR
jgi:hypothetical protein